MADTKADNAAQKDLEIQVHIAEYQAIRDEILHRVGSASQSLLISLSSYSVILPLLFSQSNSLPPIILVSLFYILTIVYAVIGMQYATTTYYLFAEGNYIHQILSPKINSRLKTISKNNVLQAETYLRSARHNFVALFLSSVGGVATGLIILLPSLVSLIVAQYIFLLPATHSSQSTLALQFLSSLLLPLSITAWIFFIFSALSQLSTVAYGIMTGFVVRDSGIK